MWERRDEDSERNCKGCRPRSSWGKKGLETTSDDATGNNVPQSNEMFRRVVIKLEDSDMVIFL